jgi:uncharacterized protein YbaR (Trm112 family)
MQSPVNSDLESVSPSTRVFSPQEIALPSSRPASKGPKPAIVGFVVRTMTMNPEATLLCCPDCQIPLNLLQPDENDPSRLLGTCEHCSKWLFLVELEPDWSKSLLVELPAGEVICQNIEAAKP